MRRFLRRRFVHPFPTGSPFGHHPRLSMVCPRRGQWVNTRLLKARVGAIRELANRLIAFPNAIRGSTDTISARAGAIRLLADRLIVFSNAIRILTTRFIAFLCLCSEVFRKSFRSFTAHYRSRITNILSHPKVSVKLHQNFFF